MVTPDQAWTWFVHTWFVQHPGLWIWDHADRLGALGVVVTVIITARILVLGRNQLRLTQRAWITVKSVKFDDCDAPLKVPLITIVLQNTGPTPANQVITSMESLKRTRPRLSGRMSRLDWSDPQWGTVGPNGRVTYLWHYSERDPQDGQLHHYPLTSKDVIHAREFLRYLEAGGADVVNGADAFAFETSKVSQLLLLRRLGLPAPRTRIVNDARLVVEAAVGLRFPIAVKPNIGGSGAGIQRFETADDLRRAVAAGEVDLGIDRTALVQEFLPARGGYIVRVEVLGGRFLYAIKVYLNPDAGFNLCPADICQPGTAAQATGSAAPDLCPVELPKVALRVEGYTPPAPVIGAVLAIAREASLDIAGVEYLVNDRDGEVYYYDINVLSNFVTNAVSVVGFDPYATLVDYLAVRGRFRVPVPAGA